MKLSRTLVTLCAVALFPSSVAFALAIRVNGVCYAGDCSSPDVLVVGQTITTPFNFTVTLANGDQYQVSGSLTAIRDSGGITRSGSRKVVYLGRASSPSTPPISTPSGADAFTIDFLQNNAAPSTDVNKAEVEGFAPLFGGAISAASTASLLEVINGIALPQLGPFGPTSPGGSQTVVVLLPKGVAFLVDETFTFTFGGGSGVGASIGDGTAGAPARQTNGGGLCFDGGGGVSILAQSNCNVVVCALAYDGGGGEGWARLGPSPDATATATAGPIALDAGASTSGCTTFVIGTPMNGRILGENVAGPLLDPGAGRSQTTFNFGCGTGITFHQVNGVNQVLVTYDSGGGSGAGVYREGPSPEAATDDSPGAICQDGSGGAGTAGIYRKGPGPFAAGSLGSVCADGGGGVSIYRKGPVPNATGSSGPVCSDGGGGVSGAGIYRKSPNPDGVGAQVSSSTTALSAIQMVTPVQTADATYTATPACLDALGATPCWLTIPTATGSILANTRGAITAVSDPTGLGAGLYSGMVTFSITPSGAANPTSVMITFPVQKQVTPSGPKLQLSHAGLTFQVAQGAGTPPAQTIYVSNTAAASPLTFRVATTGEPWLSLSQPAGPVTAGTPVPITVQVNPAGLAPGLYSSRIDFSGPGIVNGTQSATVALRILPPAASTGLNVSSTALAFVALAGTPQAQVLMLTNPSNQTLTITTSVGYMNGAGWLAVSNPQTQVTASQPLQLNLVANLAGYPAGDYLANLTIHAAETNTDIQVVVLAVLQSPACTSTHLNALFTNLEGGFKRIAGVPIPLDAVVTDGCGNLVTAGNVTAYFPSSGDTQVELMSLGNGHWVGSWLPQATAGPEGVAANVALLAVAPAMPWGFWAASIAVTGTLTANPSNPPLIAQGGVANSASALASPIAPGQYISIYGTNLAPANASSDSYPLQTTLAGTQVLIGGIALPLQFVSSGLINALVPYETPVNGVQQLLVVQNGVYSMPLPVVVAAASPAVFSQDLSGKGPGVIVVVQPDNTQFESTPASPASAGDILVVYGTGLGAVNPPVTDGAAVPLAVFKTLTPLTATIGGIPAHVMFAGLTPTFAGLYQVNLVVPPGVVNGMNVPVVLSIDGILSPPVTVAIQ